MRKTLITIIALIALVCILTMVFVGCNAQSLTKKMEKAGYSVKSVETDKDSSAKYEWSLVASKGIVETVTVTKFKTLDDAKEAEEKAKTVNIGQTVERVGKVLYVGSEAAVKEAK